MLSLRVPQNSFLILWKIDRLEIHLLIQLNICKFLRWLLKIIVDLILKNVIVELLSLLSHIVLSLPFFIRTIVYSAISLAFVLFLLKTLIIVRFVLALFANTALITLFIHSIARTIFLHALSLFAWTINKIIFLLMDFSLAYFFEFFYVIILTILFISSFPFLFYWRIKCTCLKR